MSPEMLAPAVIASFKSSMADVSMKKTKRKSASPRSANAIDAYIGARMRERRLALNLSQNQFGKELGVSEPWQFFWLTGILSSFLDNAPTYLTFATMAAGTNDFGLLVRNEVPGLNGPLVLKAISCEFTFAPLIRSLPSNARSIRSMPATGSS